MDQVSRPISDVFKGSWTPASSPPSTLFNQINLPTPNDTTNYATSSASPGDDVFQCMLGSLGIPQQQPTGSAYGLTVRIEQIGGGSAIPVAITLLQGTTIIATTNVTPSSSYVDYTLSLTPSQIAMITDPTNLRVEVAANPYVQTTCCSNKIPATLFLSFSEITGDCGCLSDLGTITLNFDSTLQWWKSAPLPLCGSATTGLAILCIQGGGGAFSLFQFGESPGCTFFPVSPTGEMPTCSPFSVIFADTAVYTCCTGTATVTISQ